MKQIDGTYLQFGKKARNNIVFNLVSKEQKNNHKEQKIASQGSPRVSKFEYLPLRSAVRIARSIS